MTRSLRLITVLGLILFTTAACARTFTSAGLGRYDRFEPFATASSNSISLELARDAHVAIINVVLPQPAFRDRPVLFMAAYPLWETDPSRFDAGQHRLRPRRETVRTPPLCTGSQTPTIGGCRRLFEMLPGVRSLSNYYSAGNHIRGGHYLVMAASEPIDPFRLAEELFHIALERPELARALRALDAPAAAAELERALLDRPGTPDWAALYVTAR